MQKKELMNKSIHILGVRVDQVDFKTAVKKGISILKGKKSHYFVTPNPEILLKAKKDQAYRDIINGSTLNTPDGFGLKVASYILKLKGKTNSVIKNRVTGTDLAMELIKGSAEHGYSIFFLGASEESNLKTIDWAEDQGANVAGNYMGKPGDELAIKLIKDSKADLVLVAFGAPKQEYWIHENLKKLPDVKLAIGIGGAFDFISGTRKRAPKWMQDLGIEWLFRLVQEPKRLVRIFNAVIRFPLTVLKES